MTKIHAAEMALDAGFPMLPLTAYLNERTVHYTILDGRLQPWSAQRSSVNSGGQRLKNKSSVTPNDGNNFINSN